MLAVSLFGQTRISTSEVNRMLNGLRLPLAAWTAHGRVAEGSRGTANTTEQLRGVRMA